jgi:hypothetical protein
MKMQKMIERLLAGQAKAEDDREDLLTRLEAKIKAKQTKRDKKELT